MIKAESVSGLKNKTAEAAAVEAGAYRKVMWRLVPFLFLC